jgi:hypothetical protein
MSFKNYVCVTCAQDFTRKYSAYRHNRILHQERGKIVRTLEYVIGRVTGEYSSVDPIVFRRKNRQGTAIGSPGKFPFAAIAHNSHDSHSYENIRQKEYKSSNQSHDGSAKAYSADQPKDSSSSKLQSNSQSFAEPIKEKGFLSPHPQLFDLPQAAIDKLIEIEQLMSPSTHRAIVWEEIERLGKDFRITKDFNILNVALDFLKRNV